LSSTPSASCARSSRGASTSSSSAGSRRCSTGRPATDDVNLHALGDVLIELGARLRGVRDAVPFTPDARTLRRIDVLTLATVAGDLDVLARPSGAPGYAALRRRADRFDVGGFAVLVASVEDLIAMKQATGRPKDVQDVAELEAILRLGGARPTRPRGPGRPRARPR
jgi:hypothetical protein